MFKTLRVTGVMATRIKLRSLTKAEQRQLWQEFKPLKDALSATVQKSFNGGWKRLNLKDARARIEKMPGFDKRVIAKAEKAMQKLISHNTAMVISEAHRKYRRNSKLNPDDLIQAGHIGLIYALYLYEPVVDGKEIKFSSYAYRWIKALIQEEAQGDRQIKPPSNEREYKYRFVTQLKASDGDVVDVFDVLDDNEPKLLSDRCAEVLDDREYTALTQEPLMAMVELGISWEDWDKLCQQGKQKVLASI